MHQRYCFNDEGIVKIQIAELVLTFFNNRILNTDPSCLPDHLYDRNI